LAPSNTRSFTTGAFCKDFLSFDKRMGRFFRAR